MTSTVTSSAYSTVTKNFPSTVVAGIPLTLTHLAFHTGKENDTSSDIS